MKTLIQNRKILIMSLLLLYTFSIFVGCSSNNDNDEKYIAELEAKIVELEGMLEKAKELQEREPIDLEPIHDSFSQQVQQLKTELAECQQLLTEGAIIQ